LLKLVPPRNGRVIDVGCGDGLFARQLAARAAWGVALDSDPAQVRLAKARCADRANVAVLQADGQAMPFPDGSFDVVTSLAVIHHLPLEDGVTEMVRLLRPGGQLVLLGVWPDTAMLRDLVISLVAVAVNRFRTLMRGTATMDSPTQIPTMSMHDARTAFDRLVPGARVRRRLLWRYTVSWTKPTGAVGSS
jgi:ubiquinone/menaquinone biosynthesis C-methylase UbiE